MEKFTRKYTGKIGGKSINDYYLSQNATELTTYEERLKLVKDVLNIDDDGFSEDEFMMKIFEVDEGTVVNVHANKNQLWSESNVCDILESLGTYLLNAQDIKDDTRIYDTYGEYKMHKKEQDIIRTRGTYSELVKNERDNEFKPVIMFEEESYQGNYKLSKKMELKENDSSKYPQLKDYDDYRKWLKNIHDNKEARVELANNIDIKNKYSSGSLIYKSRKIRSGINDDMLLYKEHIIQPIRFKAPLKDSGCPSWDEIDFFDENQVYYLLPLKKEPNDLQDDFYWILKDLNNLIDECTFTEKQRIILECYRCGMSLSTIARHCGITDSVVQKTIKSCVKIIVNQYERKYRDWYYLNISKGQYKKCNRCGEIKLISEFNKDSKGGMGVKAYCKGCVNNDNI